MEDYSSNSHKSKMQQPASTDEKRVTKTVGGEVRKKSKAKKLKDIFVSEDVSSVKEYIFMDVLVPAIKKAISDIVTDGIDMILYGESGRNRNKSARTASSYISYDRFADNSRSYNTSARTRSSMDFDEVVFPTRGKAEEALNELSGVLRSYGIIRVADLFDIAELSAPYTSNRYGWSSLAGVEPVRAGDGYILSLPKAMPID